ncbi:MAG: sigma-70 family RNA polymerase sigma factor [Syntrophomonas sp.]
MTSRDEQKVAAEFFNQEYPSLFRYALFLTGEGESAEELCQEAFLRWFTLPDQQTIEYPRAWLKRVLSHLAVNYFRRQKLRSRLETVIDPEKIESTVAMENDIQRLEVEDIISRLPWRDQMLLKMKTAGITYKEMAEILNISIGSVGTLLSRAMERFRHEYQEKEGSKENEMRGSRPTLTVLR